MSMGHEGDQKDLAKRERKFTKDLPKYFIHGLLYAILGTLAKIVFAVLSTVATLIVVAVSGFWGLLLGYIVLSGFLVVLLIVIFFVTGLINTRLAKSLWKANPPKGFKSRVGHGIVLVFILFIFGLPNLAIDYIFPDLDIIIFIVIAIPRVVIFAIIDGFLGRWIAYGFSDFPKASKSLNTGDGIVGTCPKCRAETIVLMQQEMESKFVVCHGCGNPFDIPWPED